MASLPGALATGALVRRGWSTAPPPGVSPDDDWCGDCYLVDPKTGSPLSWRSALAVQRDRDAVTDADFQALIVRVPENQTLRDAYADWRALADLLNPERIKS